MSNPDNGEVNMTAIVNGSTAIYTCDSGFQLSGDDTRTCLNTGVWSGQKPICLRMKNAFVFLHCKHLKSVTTSSVALCSELSNPDNGVATWTGLTNGSTATYTCVSGYQLSGDQIRTCLSTGLWSGQEPICQCMKNFKP